MKNFFFILFLLILNQVFAQDSIIIKFQTLFKNENVILNKYYILNNDSISFEKLKFYISNISFFKNDSIVCKFEKEFHLIDVENPNTFFISQIKTLNFDKIKFNIGIDSLTNVSGAFGDDLDPTNGMYWAWQSGYINFKLEGNSKICKSRNNRFQIHLGGYQDPFNSLQEIEFQKINNKLNIEFRLDKFLDNINLSQNFEVMSPSNKAIEFSKILKTCFYIGKF